METNLTRGNVTGVLVRFALPLFAANLLQSLYSLVDMAVMGRFLGSPGLAALGSSATICYVITSVCAGVTTGGSVLVAQYLGREDRAALRETVGSLFSLSLAVAAAVTALSLVAYDPVLRWMGVPADALPLALEYMSVICIGTVFILGYNAVCAVLRGMGDSKGPLLYVAVAAAANIALDLLFVGPLALGAAGAAMATVCAQALSFFIALFSLRRRGFLRSLSRVDLLPRPVRWASILRIGLPTAVQLSVVNLSYLAVTGLFNACGTACAAAAGVGLKLNTFAAMPCWAVGQAVTTMAGQCMGGGAPDRAARTARSGLVLALAGSGATAALIVLTAPGLIALFDPAPAVVAAGTLYLRICCSLNFLAYAAMYLFDSFATGVGYPGLAMGNALLHSVVMRLGLSWLLGLAMGGGFAGLCWAEMLAPFPGALIGAVFFLRGRWRERRLV